MAFVGVAALHTTASVIRYAASFVLSLSTAGLSVLVLFFVFACGVAAGAVLHGRTASRAEEAVWRAAALEHFAGERMSSKDVKRYLGALPWMTWPEWHRVRQCCSSTSSVALFRGSICQPLALFESVFQLWYAHASDRRPG